MSEIKWEFNKFNKELLIELAEAKALFQQKSILLAMGILDNQPNKPHSNSHKPTKGQ